MKYNRTEIQHFEELNVIFGGEIYIDGEHPFFVDDRMMDEDFANSNKHVYRDGERTTRNEPPASTTDKLGNYLLNRHQFDYWMSNIPESNKDFVNFILKNWETLLTEKQQIFLTDVLNGNEKDYDRRYRHIFRTRIQNRLKKAYLGKGGQDIPAYMVEQYRNRLNTVKQFEAVSNDNVGFSALLAKKLDNDWVNDVVYSKMKKNSRQAIVDFKLGKSPRIPAFALYEFYDNVMDEKDFLNGLDLT